jgi:hypothetical protein
MREQLTQFLVELAQVGFLHESSAEMHYTSKRGTKAALLIVSTGRAYKVVCKSEGGHREQISSDKLTIKKIWSILPQWLQREIDQS